jgi:hypothetical protein
MKNGQIGWNLGDEFSLNLAFLKKSSPSGNISPVKETVKISRFAQLEWGYVWGHIFCRFRRGNDEDT